MGDSKVLFGWVISSLNFMLLAILFNKIVIESMAVAVRVRGERVTNRLKEIDGILSEAKSTEETYAAQMARFAAEEAEMRATSEREIGRVVERIRSAAEADAKHIVDKARREGEKQRVEALAALQRQLVAQAISQVEGSLRKNIDSDGLSDANSQVMTRVEALRAS